MLLRTVCSWWLYIDIAAVKSGNLWWRKVHKICLGWLLLKEIQWKNTHERLLKCKKEGPSQQNRKNKEKERRVFIHEPNDPEGDERSGGWDTFNGWEGRDSAATLVLVLQRFGLHVRDTETKEISLSTWPCIIYIHDLEHMSHPVKHKAKLQRPLWNITMLLKVAYDSVWADWPCSVLGLSQV